MFTNTRLIILLIVSILITVGLYYIDKDPSADSIIARIENTAIVFGIMTGIYSIAYKLGKQR